MLCAILFSVIAALFPITLHAQSIESAPTYVVLVGPPGSGKGTLSEQLTQQSQLPVITTSQVLKKLLQSNTTQAQKIKQQMAAGELISDETILAIMKTEISKPQYAAGAIFDGFPRTLAQTRFFNENQLTVQALIVLNISDEAIIQRMQGRRVHGPSGRVYHIDNRPPKTPGIDDVTGEPLEQRSDDQPSVVKSRLVQYREITKPVIHWANQQAAMSDGQVQQVINLDAKQSVEHMMQSLCQAVAAQDGSQLGCAPIKPVTTADSPVNTVY